MCWPGNEWKMATAGLLRTDREREVVVAEQQALKHYAGSRATTVRSLLLRFFFDNEIIYIIINSHFEMFVL
jgi:hypothetical protein